jgi:hypothetical protein
MQRLDLRSNLFKAGLAFNVALIDIQCLLARLKPFQAHGS